MIKQLGTNGGGPSTPTPPIRSRTPRRSPTSLDASRLRDPRGAHLHVRADGRRHAPRLGALRRHVVSCSSPASRSPTGPRPEAARRSSTAWGSIPGSYEKVPISNAELLAIARSHPLLRLGNEALRDCPKTLGEANRKLAALAEVRQRITDMIPTDIAGSALWPKYREVIQQANSVPSPPKVLICTYEGKQYSFWYAAPPRNLQDFMKIDAQNGVAMAGLGTDALQKCPPDQTAAARTASINGEKWRSAISKLPN